MPHIYLESIKLNLRKLIKQKRNLTRLCLIVIKQNIMNGFKLIIFKKFSKHSEKYVI